MSLTDEVTFDKEGHIERFPWLKKLYLSAVVILVAGLSFGLGRLSTVGERREGVRIDYNPEIINSQFPISNEASVSRALNSFENSKLKTENSTSVVASKNGTKYHYPHCSGAKRIKGENKITFASAEAAEASGYTLASNCRKP